MRSVEQARIAKEAVTTMQTETDKGLQMNTANFLSALDQLGSTVIVNTPQAKTLLELLGTQDVIRQAVEENLQRARLENDFQSLQLNERRAYLLRLKRTPEITQTPILQAPAIPTPPSLPLDLTNETLEKYLLEKQPFLAKEGRTVILLHWQREAECNKLKFMVRNSPEYQSQLELVRRLEASLDGLIGTTEDESFAGLAKTAEAIESGMQHRLSFFNQDAKKVLSELPKNLVLYGKLFGQGSPNVQAAFDILIQAIQMNSADIGVFNNVRGDLLYSIDNEAGVFTWIDGKILRDEYILARQNRQQATETFNTLLKKPYTLYLGEITGAIKEINRCAIQRNRTYAEILARENYYLNYLATRAGLEIIPGEFGVDIQP